MNRLFRFLMNISAVMFAAGIALPYFFHFVLNGYNWSPVIWNILQIGGLGGLVVFWLMFRLTKPKKNVSEIIGKE